MTKQGGSQENKYSPNSPTLSQLPFCKVLHELNQPEGRRQKAREPVDVVHTAQSSGTLKRVGGDSGQANES